MTDFSALGLSVPVMNALENEGFKTATEIQAATIPTLLKGSDVIGLAQTGSGKTAAFVLPMIEHLLEHTERPKEGMPRALILAPTRELAIQITEAIKALSQGTKLRNCTIFGGAPYRTQTHILRRGVDILVATPGRLQDHMKRGNIYLDEVEYFVLDEADRMLDMGFVDDVRNISAHIRGTHQSVMFSATLNEKIRDLATTLLRDPAHIEVAREATIADNLTHKVMFVDRRDKHDLLLHMIEDKRVYKALVFVRTKKEADELAIYMEANGYKVDAIHGDKQQRQRERIIRAFKTDRIDFLVATDVAARGIDVKDIGHVFNIDVPVEAESYVHRIGRTARGGKSGEAFTFCSRSEFGLLQAIERLIKMRIEIDHDHPFPQPVAPKAKNRAAVRRRPSGPRQDAAPKRRKDRKDRTPLSKQTNHRKGPGAKADHAKPANAKPVSAKPARAKAAGMNSQDAAGNTAPAKSGKPGKAKRPAIAAKKAAQKAKPFGKGAGAKPARGKPGAGPAKAGPARAAAGKSGRSKPTSGKPGAGKPGGSRPQNRSARPKKSGGYETLKRRG
jgi:ATP-dependent RNA helicase RhlE